MFRLSIVNVLVAVAFVASAQASCLHGTTFMRREEGKVPVATFGYSGEKGPANWAGLSKDNHLCNTGTHQSPIVLTPEIPYAEAAPQWQIPSVPEAEFENLGSTVEVIVEGALTYQNKTYVLKQYHAHVPSEHRIKEEFYPAEVHFVHQAEDESLLVVAVPFQLAEDGKTTALLTSTITHLADIAVPGTATKTGPLDFGPVIQAVTAGPLFAYSGSLTTPPCKEGVQFLVLEKPLPIDVKTFNALKSVIKFNSRFSQNTPGAQNVLEIAKEQSLEAEGAGHGGHNGTAGGAPVDVNALVQALIASGKQMKYETVTKSETTVTLVDADTEVPPAGEPVPEPAPSTEPPAPSGSHAPGPANPVRRSNISRRRV